MKVGFKLITSLTNNNGHFYMMGHEIDYDEQTTSEEPFWLILKYIE